MYNIFPPLKCPKFNETAEWQTSIYRDPFIRRIYYENFDRNKILVREMPSSIRAYEAETKALAPQILAIKCKEIHKEVRQKQITQNDVGFRLWKSRVDGAKTAKTLKLQKMEAAKKREEALAMKKQEIEQRKKDEERDNCDRKINDIKSIKEKAQYRDFLLSQVAEHDNVKKRTLQQIEVEREERLRLIKQKNDEEKVRKQILKEQKEQFHKEFVKCVNDGSNFKKNERKRQLAEDLYYLKLLGESEENRNKTQIDKQKIREQKMELNAQMAWRNYNEEKKKNARQDFLRDFLVEEKWYKDIQKHNAQLEKEAMDRKILSQTLQYENAERLYRARMGRIKRAEIERQEYEKLLKKVKLQNEIDEQIEKNRKIQAHYNNFEMNERQRQQLDLHHQTKTENVQRFNDEQRKLNNAVKNETYRFLKSQPPDVLSCLQPKVYREAMKILAEGPAEDDSD